MWNQIENYFYSLPLIARNIILIIGAILAGLLIKWIISFFLHQACKNRKGFSLIRSVLLRLGRPITFFLPLLIIDMVLPIMELPPGYYLVLHKITGILIAIAFAMVLIGVVKVVEDYISHLYHLDDDIHDLKERKIRTQLQFLRKLIIVVIVILTICAILLSFDNLRKLGAGLLTGVGIGGIIVGFAAQRSLGNLFAGLQIAFTQPIRIDDGLLVEGEFGIVEDITLTYVVMNLWDQRRLILPINYFIERPFQNWTRASTELLGTVHLFLDYSAPVEAIRKEFTRLLGITPLWDKRASAIQVTNATENTMEVRALVSAANSGALFELRCYVRENLITFIQQHYPQCLPKTRTEFISHAAEAEHDGPGR